MVGGWLCGLPLPVPPVPHPLSIVLNKNIGQRPLGDVKEDDPQKLGFHNVPQRIFHMHCNIILPSFGHDALKFQQLVNTGR